MEAALPEHVRQRQVTKGPAPAENPTDVLELPEVTEELWHAADLQQRLRAEGQPVTPYATLCADTLLRAMPPEEQLLRTTFVEQYLYDYDPVHAACRLGYSMEPDRLSKQSPAKLIGFKLLREPVVQRLIREYTYNGIDIKERKQQIFTALYREAMAPETPIQSKIKALATLIEAFGWDDQAKERKRLRQIQEDLLSSQNNRAKGGVMRIPIPMADEDWESMTISSQEKLQAEVVE